MDHLVEIQADHEEAQRAIAHAMRRGDYLVAFDLAQHAADAYSSDLRFEYAATLALARANATEQAAQRYNARLRDRTGETANPLAIDILALGARIEKDRAFRVRGSQTREAMRKAANAYAMVFEQTRAAYPAINAATLAMLADDVERARAFARCAMAAVQRENPASDLAQYYRFATLAEAHVVLGSIEDAEAVLARAVACAPSDFDAHATTLRQLRRLAQHLGSGTTFLAPLQAPGSLHYAGHRFDETVSADDERRIAAEIARLLESRSIGFAFGSLAAGADILFAEAAIQRGCSLHIVLPFQLEDTISICVAPSGAQWVDRFARCLEQAGQVTYATSGRCLGDDAPYEYASHLAMGLAILQGARLLSDVNQAVVWDGIEGDQGAVAGTWADMNSWQATGHRTEVIAMAPNQRAFTPPGDRALRANRRSCALLFGDIKHFSKLPDDLQMRYAERVLSAFAAVLNRFDGIELRNTWGDGLFIVIQKAATAAACALELQEAIAAIDLRAAGFPADMGLRLCAHFGPVFTFVDPITQRRNFAGEHVCRTARFEPVTPEGSVFVTEAFAAEISLRADLDFRCEYVGEIDAAKDYGKFRMYALMRGR